MCQAIPFFFPQTPVLWPFQVASSMAARLQMPMCMFCRKMIIILFELLQQLSSIFVNHERSTLRSLQIETEISDWCRLSTGNAKRQISARNIETEIKNRYRYRSQTRQCESTDNDYGNVNQQHLRYSYLKNLVSMQLKHIVFQLALIGKQSP